MGILLYYTLANEDARKVVTFNGLVTLRASTLGEMKEEVYTLLTSNYEPALSKIRADQPARAKQSAISKAKAKAGPPPAAARQTYSSEDWNRWHYGGYHGRTWYSAAEWRRYPKSYSIYLRGTIKSCRALSINSSAWVSFKIRIHIYQQHAAGGVSKVPAKCRTMCDVAQYISMDQIFDRGCVSRKKYFTC